MKDRPAKKAARGTGERPAKPEAVGAYADLLTADELARFAARASLVDEVLLLRAQLHRLARRIDLDDEECGLKKLRVLIDMVRAIATLERVRLLTGSREAEAGLDLPRVVAIVKPSQGL